MSKAALRRVREATAAKQAEGAISAERAAEKREEYRKAQGQGIPQVVTDRMLKRITIFSGVPLLMGFATGPAFYGLKVIAKVDVAPWQFFFASTATFGGALLGITYGVLSASWEPGREGTFWGRGVQGEHPDPDSNRHRKSRGPGRKRIPGRVGRRRAVSAIRRAREQTNSSV